MFETIRTKNSSVFNTVAYNPHTGILKVEMKNGKLYAYTNVPARIWKGFLSASSLGSFYNKAIKGSFHFVKIEEDDI